MKFMNILPLAALATAFVIPDEQVMNQIAIEAQDKSHSVFDTLPSKDQLSKDFEKTFDCMKGKSKNVFDQAFETASEANDKLSQKLDDTAVNTKLWVDSASTALNDHPGRHGHLRHRHDTNMTVYQLIAESKYTTKLAKLINDYPDLVEALNGTAANYTIFAPTDHAFEKIPEHAPKPSKEQLKKVLEYHVSADYYPAGKVLVTHTIPTLLEGEDIGFEKQRLSINIGLRGLTANFYSRIVAINIFGTNGVIHGVDSILVPPPKAAEIISLLPGEFSTLELGLTKTDLLPALNDTSNHIGGTVFAPSNFAFQKLGPRINGFLFSRYGQKYLKALLKYHIVANQTLYSDAYYKPDEVLETGLPNGYFHIDLPTLLDGRSLGVDVGRYGRLIHIRINGFSTVVIEDGIAADGVIQVVNNVLIPPKQVEELQQEWHGEELSEEDLKERLEPFVDQGEL